MANQCEQTKKAVIKRIDQLSVSLNVDMGDLTNLVETIPCGTKGTRKKRAPSAYNIHIGQCMKQGGSMKDCASQWSQRKGK